MKKLLNLTLAALLMLGAVSCSKDNVNTPAPVPPGPEGSFTFAFKGLGTVESYAIATDAENAVKNFHVVMYDRDAKKLLAVLEAGKDCELSATGLTRTLVIPDIAQYGTGKKDFYFLANAASVADVLTHANMTPENFTPEWFHETLTKSLAGDPGDDLANIKAAVAEDGLLFTKLVEEVDTRTGVYNNEVQMRRRVARFDIVNEYHEKVIKDIYVIGAKAQGAVWEMSEAATTEAIATGTHKIEGPTTYTVVDEERIALSAFYLNPTTVKADKSATTLGVLVEEDGNESIYEVLVEEDLDIVANTRYKLILTGDMVFTLIRFMDWDDDEGQHYLVGDPNDTYTISDWDWVPVGTDFDIFDPAGANGTMVIWPYVHTDHREIKFKVTSGGGTTYKINWLEGTTNDVTEDVKVEKTSKVTYGMGMEEHYTVTIPYSDKNVMYTVDVEISSKHNPRAPKATLRMDDDQLMFDQTAFPDAEFRRYIADQTGWTDGQEVTREAFKTCLNDDEMMINKPGPNTTYEIESFEGIRYFTELKKFHHGIIWGNNGYSEHCPSSLDLSRNTKLEDVSFASTQLTSLNLDGLKELKKLHINLSKLTSFDFVRSITSLKEFHMNVNQHVTSIDLSCMPNLEYVRINGDSKYNPVDDTYTYSVLTSVEIKDCPKLETFSLINEPNLETIDLSGSRAITHVDAVHTPKLTSLELNTLVDLEKLLLPMSGITYLDISKNRKLINLNIAVSNPSDDPESVWYVDPYKETVIKVWSGFPVDNPGSVFTYEQGGGNYWDYNIEFYPNMKITFIN